ncbi:MAG: D-2-hydroxyacid dehydrogenase [Chlamydiia bacterium]|nr:D-2-hydroxyacid dehydrogenase [Chlamydiia bacterium]
MATEFPQFKFIHAAPDRPLASLGVETCGAVEILYGSDLKVEELGLVPNLHWIHCPRAYLDRLCVDALIKQGNILISSTKEENLETIGEFALCAALAFAKCIFHWEKGGNNIEALRAKMWSAKKCLFLQVGLGRIGSEIARRAAAAGFEVLGVQELASFHPHCKATYNLEELKNLLPKAHIVCLAAPRDKKTVSWFDREEFALMREDSAFMAFGNGAALDIEALAEFAEKGKFRGVLLDAHFRPPLPPESPLWKIPYVINSRESSAYPMTENFHSFHGFLYNLRQYIHGNFGDMRYLLNPPESILQ